MTVKKYKIMSINVNILVYMHNLHVDKLIN